MDGTNTGINNDASSSSSVVNIGTESKNSVQSSSLDSVASASMEYEFWYVLAHCEAKSEHPLAYSIVTY